MFEGRYEQQQRQMAAYQATSGERRSKVEELHTLVCEHLRGANVPSYLVESVQNSLRKASQNPKFDSRLLQEFFLLSPRPRNEYAEPSAKTAQADTTVASGSCPTRRNWWLATLGAFFLCMVFGPCVTYSEWYIDELFAAVRNADARGETSFRELLKHDFWGNSLQGGWTHKSYRPLVVLSYAAQCWLNSWDFRPQPLRAFNVAIHACNSALLVFLLRRLNVAAFPAFLAAGFFAVHPVHAENVIYLVGRADAMATFCWLVACLCWQPPRRQRRLVSHALRIFLVSALAVLGGFCKESGFCVLLHLAVMELLGPRPLSGAVPLVSVFGLIFLGRNWITSGTSAGFSFVDTPVQYRNDPLLRLATYLYFHAKYAQLMVFPWTLSWDYSYDALPDLAASWQDVRVLSILAAYLGISALAAWAFAMRKRLVLIGLSNIIIPFVPASNLFFVVGVTVGERLLYPCNVGLAILIGTFGTRSTSREALKRMTTPTGKSPKDTSFDSSASFHGPAIFKALLLGMLAVFTWLARVRTCQWASRELLFAADAQSYPRSTKARHQLGIFSSNSQLHNTKNPIFLDQISTF